MSLKSLSHLLGAIETQDTWKGRQQFQQIVTCWCEVVGPAVAVQTRPIALQRRVLQVATSSSVWAQNLVFERHRIVEKLNTRLGLGLSDIRFSTAQWRSDYSANPHDTSETTVLWQRHPSRISEDATLTGSMAKDPQTAFRHWARTMRSRGQSLPVCPACQCPTPVGELKRWSVCALCATKRFAAPPSPPAAP